MNSRKLLFVLGLLLVVCLAVGAGLFLFRTKGRQPREERSTYAVAEAYLAAIMDGDKAAALSLYRGDPLCSSVISYVYERLDEHIAMLKSAEVRNIRIEVETAQGVPYTPGSERAGISLEVKKGLAWRSGTIWLVTGPAAAGKRSICHLR